MKRAEVNKMFTFEGHRDCIYSLEANTLPGQFFSGSGDGMVVRWDLEKPDEGELIAKVSNSVYSMALQNECNHLIIGQNFSGLHIIDLTTKQQIRNLVFTSAAIFDIKICLDQVWVCDGNGTVYIFDAEDFSLLHQIKTSDNSARSIAFNPFENDIAIGFSDHCVRIFDRVSFQMKKELKGHSNSVFAVTYSPEGRYLLSAGRDAHIHIRDAHQEYSLTKDIPAHMFAVNHLVFSPDGHYFASGSMDKSVKVWDANTFELIKVIDKARHAGHGTSVNKLLWLSETNYLVTGSDDRSIGIWALDFYEKTILS